MRKISFLLIAVLIFTSFTWVFAQDNSLVDLGGTKYEEPVKALMDKGLITGYPDGTYRPNSSISRAEASLIIVKSLDPSGKKLESVKEDDDHFPDLGGYDWAAKYINYAAKKGVISGYPDGNFKPGNLVTYEEMASMLIRAMGYSKEELTGLWPNNYLAKALALGIFKDVQFSVGQPALRGNVALMTYSVVDHITDGTKPEEPKEEDQEEEGTEPEDPLFEFSGRAYGILTEVAMLLNKKGEVVDEYEFLIGKGTRYIETNGRIQADSSATIQTHLDEGDLYGLQMNNGVITKFDTSDNNFVNIGSPTGLEKFTTDWTKVIEVKNHTIKIEVPYNGRDTLSVLEDASIYLAKEDGGKITGYEPATMRDIKKDDLVRLYSVTGKTPGVVEIVLVK